MLTAEAMTARQKSLAVLVLVVALVLEIVDTTIVNTALPAIKAGIGADPVHAQWIVAGYSVSFALLLMAGGRLGDSYGYRRMLVWGVAGFTLASAACGLAQDGGQLVAARLLQGATGAVMAPQSMALMQVLFDPLERVAKMAMFGLIGGLAAIVGPILGGVLIHADLFGLGWRLLFLINLPIGLLTIVAALRLLPPTRSGRHVGYDTGGMLWFALAVAALLWPLIGSEGGAGRHHPGATLPLIAAALPLGWLGWRHVAARVGAGRPALFDPSLFAVPTFRTGLVMAMAFAAANGGFLLVFAFALQVERGQTPLVTGLLHMPFGFGAMVGIGLLSRKLLPRFGRVIPLFGSLVMTLSCGLVLGAIGWHWPLATIVPAMIAAGVGMG
ncbi:MAG TPA: MFS transporter, partial [Novosphingobium sp.]